MAATNKPSSIASPDATRSDEASNARLVFKPEVCDRVGATFVTIWGWMRKGQFPRARVIGGKSAWIASEIDDWISALPKRRYKGDPEPNRNASIAAPQTQRARRTA